MSLQKLASYSRLDHEAEQMISLSLQETPRKKNDFARISDGEGQNCRAKATQTCQGGKSKPWSGEVRISDKSLDRRNGSWQGRRWRKRGYKTRSAIRKTERRRGKEILSKVCALEVCKPEICCADMEGKLPFLTTAQTSFRWVDKAIYFFGFYASPGMGRGWTR